MKPVNKKGQEVLNYLAEMAEMSDGHVKIDNTDGCFMPVCIEHIGENLLSIAHYYEQNSDLMADPEIVFYLRSDGLYYPVSYKQDNLGIYRESVYFTDGKPTSYHKKEQADEAVFAGIWMRNIRNQQSLKV